MTPLNKMTKLLLNSFSNEPKGKLFEHKIAVLLIKSDLKFFFVVNITLNYCI